MTEAEKVVNEINSARGDGDEQGLRKTAALLDMLQAWPECPVIHVAGTNGKGSVCAMLNSILNHAGFRTGLYTSPFLQTYRERIRMNSSPISEEQLAQYGQEILNAAKSQQEDHRIRNTPFELGTALAFHVFRQEKADIIISETGLGGRLDPTNVIPKPAVCAITAIGMDHMQILGNTLKEIAGEKAGIIKQGVPVVCYPQDEDDAAKVFIRTAARNMAPLILLTKQQVHILEITEKYSLADYETKHRRYERIRLSLPGEHQLFNALTVLEITDQLIMQGIRIPEDAVRSGLAETFWPGRLEWYSNILMDGAHNAQGITAFRKFTDSRLPGRRKILLTGVLKEKLSDDMLTQLSETADEAVTVTPESPRALQAEELSKLLQQKGMKACAANSLKEGLEQARKAAGDDGLILATGSLYFIGALRSELGLKA